MVSVGSSRWALSSGVRIAAGVAVPPEEDASEVVCFDFFVHAFAGSVLIGPIRE